MIYLYAITPRSGRPLPDRAGMGDQALEKLEIGPVDAVISRCLGGRFPLSESNLWIHEGVVESLMKTRCTLPVRFGTYLSDEEALVELIARNLDTLLVDIVRLEGCVELGLRVLGASPEEHETGELSAMRIHESILAEVEGSLDTTPGAQGALLTGIYLVKKDRLQHVQAHIGRLRARFEGLNFLCTGPWPPYHFVNPVINLPPCSTHNTGIGQHVLNG